MSVWILTDKVSRLAVGGAFVESVVYPQEGARKTFIESVSS